MQFRSAAEARSLGEPLVRLFATALARSPSASELTGLTQRMRAGDDLGEIAIWLTGTDEFLARHGPDGPPDRHYLRALFWAVTGQDPPDLERDRLLAQSNATRASLLAQISQSPAAYDALTLERTYYGGALPPDDSVAYQLWLEAGGERPLAFAGAIPDVTVTLVVLAPSARTDLLDETLASLAAQTSPHWEALVVAADAVPHPDARVRTIEPGPTRADTLTRAAAAATGRLVGFIEASDLLAPQAVEAAARRFAATPGLRVIYTDEDTIAGDGVRSGAVLKPGWSPDLLLSGDALGQLVLFDRQAMEAAGGLSPEAGGFALLDLALRLTVDAAPGTVAHQPGILFHRGRAQTGRPAPFPATRASNGVAELDAVIDRFLAQHRPGLQRGSRQSGSRIWPTVTTTLPAPRISVILAPRDPAQPAGDIAGLDAPGIEVIPADAEASWPARVNRAAAQATGDVLVLLNGALSTRDPGWLNGLVAHAARPGVGLAGGRLVSPGGRLRQAGILLGPRGAIVQPYVGAAEDEPGYLAQVMLLRDVSAVSGACLAIRRALFQELGGLDETGLPTAWSDIDLCLCARAAGHRVLWDPAATLVQPNPDAQPAVEQQARIEAERATLRRRWPEATEHDPFLNPFLHAAPSGLVLRSAKDHPAGGDPEDVLTVEWQAEIAQLRRDLDRARADADRLHRLWPRAELQRLHLELAQLRAGSAGLATDRDALAARLGSLPAPLFEFALRLRTILRVGRLAGRVLRAVRRLPQRRALLRQRRADYAAIAGSALFDRAWYRATAMNGDRATDPVAHYLWQGAPAGREPNPLFDSAWYAARAGAIALANPFAHYIRHGVRAGDDPHPLFDTAFYVAQAPEAAGRALEHYMALPSGDTRSPTRLFDPVDYPQGLLHWIQAGAGEDRDPHALFATAWYRRTYLGGDRARNPLAHWVREGEAAGFVPNPYGLPAATPPAPPVPHPDPAVTVVVQLGPRAMDTTRTLLSLQAQSGSTAVEVILAGEGPASRYAGQVRRAPSLRAATALAKARTLVLLDAGAVVHAGWLQPLLDTAEADPHTVIVGCRTLDADGSLRSAGAVVTADGRIHHATATDPAHPSHAFAHAVDAVCAGAMLVRRECWDAIGGFDDAYQTPGYAAADAGFSARAHGWRVMVQPASTVTLLEAPPVASDEDWRRLRQRWAADLSRQAIEPDLALWQAAPFRALVLTDRVPAPGDTGADAEAIVRLLRPGNRIALHPAQDGGDAAYWEQRGLEILRSPVSFEEWLAVHGTLLDEIWSFRAPGSVPADLLRRCTGARLQTGALPEPAGARVAA